MALTVPICERASDLELSITPYIVYSDDPAECAIPKQPKCGLPPGFTNLNNPHGNTKFGDCKTVNWPTDNILIVFGTSDNGFNNIGFYSDTHCMNQADVPNQVGDYERNECMHPSVYGSDQIGSVRTLG